MIQTSDDHEELQQAIFDCRVQLRRLCLSSRSARVRRWMELRSAFLPQPIHDPHEMSAEDWRALSVALERILTPELCVALSSLAEYMQELRLTFHSDEIRHWLERYDIANEGLSVDSTRKLEAILRRIYDEEAIQYN